MGTGGRQDVPAHTEIVDDGGPLDPCDPLAQSNVSLGTLIRVWVKQPLSTKSFACKL